VDIKMLCSVDQPIKILVRNLILTKTLRPTAANRKEQRQDEQKKGKPAN
jgi:hypothetical protein